MATNAYGQDRLEELCLLWIPLKLNEDAQPIYSKCVHKDKNWPLLRVELAEALEDPMIKRRWARNKDAYKKAAGMSLQIYRANIIGLVDKYSPALKLDQAAYTMELYVRFVDGLEADLRDYIQESIPYGEETIDSAYNQALKYEAKTKGKTNSAAAMRPSRSDQIEEMRREIDEIKAQLDLKDESSSSSSDSPRAKGSDSDSDGGELKAIVYRAFCESMKDMKIVARKRSKRK